MLAALILAVLLVGLAAFWVGQNQAERAKTRQSAVLMHAALTLPVHNAFAPVILRG